MTCSGPVAPIRSWIVLFGAAAACGAFFGSTLVGAFDFVTTAGRAGELKTVR
jgi:hypothetical protein